MSPLQTALLVFAAVGAFSEASVIEDRALVAFRVLQREQVIVNDLVDHFLDLSRKAIVSMDRDQIPLPDNTVTESGFKVNLTQGWMKQLSSVHRTSDASVSYGAGIVTIEASFGLQVLNLGFTLDVKSTGVIPISKHGCLGVTVGANSLRLQVSMRYNGDKCEVGVDSVKLETLEDLKPTLTDFGMFTSVINSIVNSKLDAQKIGEEVEREIEKLVLPIKVSCGPRF